MPRRLTADEVARVLAKNGFVLTGQRGSHQKWKNFETGAQTILPKHKNMPLPIGTLHSIIRATKIPKSEFGF